MRLLFPVAYALSLSACSNSTTAFSARASDAHADLNQSFVEDAMPQEHSKQMDLRDVAFTLPIFEVSPELRHDWVYLSGIGQRTSRVISYKCDGACPAPTIRLLRTEEPIQIEVSFFTSGIPVRYRFERHTGGWLYLCGPK